MFSRVLSTHAAGLTTLDFGYPEADRTASMRMGSGGSRVAREPVGGHWTH